ncbi:MAG: hypothetical protein Q9197_001111 [Variospora fuerteventurae]
MEELTMKWALTRIRSNVMKDRSDGLADLKHIISQKRNRPKIELLSDKAYHQIFEALFTLATLESSAFFRSKSNSQKSGATSRLSSCANVLRILAELGVAKLRLKTVKALLDHITQTLPNPSGGYCEPLASGYFKALRAVLEHAAHPEHLSNEEWNGLVDFSVQAFKNLVGSADDDTAAPAIGDDEGSNDRGRLSRSATPSIRLASATQRSNGTSSVKQRNDGLGPPVEDIIACLKYLASTSNAPVLDKAHLIADTMFYFLSTSTHRAPVQQAAFETVNAVLSRASTNDVSLTLHSVSELVPIVKRRWSIKSSTLKDHMMASLLLVEPYLAHAIVKYSEDEALDLQGLIDVMRDEYCRRHNKDQLQVDDLDFVSMTTGTRKERPLSNLAMRLRFGLGKAESPWSLLYLSAVMTAALTRRVEAIDDRVQDHHLAKRRKKETPIDSVFRRLKLPGMADRVYALQMLCFLFDMVPLDPTVLQVHLETILQYVSDKNASLCSWAMLAILSASGKTATRTPSTDAMWIQIWRVTARHLTISTTCRAACHLMTSLLDLGLVRYMDIADIADGMVSSMDLSGPVDIVDSALALCSEIVLRKGSENALVAAETADRFLNWLFHVWRPSLFHDRQRITSVAQHCSAQNVLQLIEVCIGNELRSANLPDVLEMCVLGAARCQCLKAKKTIQYLLLDSTEKQEHTQPFRTSRTEGEKITLTGLKKQALMAKVLDFLLAEISNVLQGLQTSPNLTADILSVTATLCIVSYSFLAHQQSQKIRRYDELRQGTQSLLEHMVRSVSPGAEQSESSSGLFDALAKVVPGVTELLAQTSLLMKGIVDMLRAIDAEMWFDFCSNESSNTVAVQDDIEKSDSEFESQASSKPTQNGAKLSYSAAAAVSDSTAFRSSLAAKLCLISSTRSLPGELSSGPALTSQFVELLVSLPPVLFISCRHFLQDLFSSEVVANVQEATTLLQYVGRELLQSDTFERSETAIGLALDIVTGIVDLWTNAENFDVSEAAADIYDWLIRLTLERQLASSKVLICMSILLQRLIRTSPDYGRSLNFPSARTSLFKVLADGDLDVKFSVGNNISEIFGLFVLKEHEHILEDVIDTLPKAANWLDGIALRLYILCRLAQSWPTLLRRCVYAIYETPAAVPASAGHAKWCLNEVSKSLHLQDPQELFRLFSSQILYTWLETHSLQSIPYSIFGYESLKDLLLDVQDEVAGQIMMRQKEDEAAQLVGESGKPFGQVVEESVGKVTGYCIAQDVATPASKTTQAPGAEVRLRKMVGKERYGTLVSAQFHDVLLTFFKSMDEDKSIEKAFANHPHHKTAQTAYHEMKELSSSSATLPLGQQPSFKARYILDDIAYICRRTDQPAEAIWSPSLYVYIFRGLLDTLHSALGSQHACSTIRKLRVLVAIAGTTALKSYPIEMALQSLRPFLTDIHCSEDSIGIFQYLLMAGEPYLKSVPTFIAGLGIVSLLGLKSFLGSSQASTTQESQHKATMTKASNFHNWLGTHLSRYVFEKLPTNSATALKRLVEAARSVRASGNAHRGSHESELLMAVLDDTASSRRLLNEPSRDLILRQLCTDFDRPSSFRDDIFGLDVEAARYAPILWRLIQKNDYGESFQLWTGSILGRAYASTGEANRRMALETDSDLEETTAEEGDAASVTPSESYILQAVNNLLLVEDHRIVGIAEKTLRFIVSRAERTDLFIECEQSLPSSIVVGLIWKHYSLPMLSTTSVSQRSIEDIATSFSDSDAHKWAQALCIALAVKAKDDVLLSALPFLLTEVDSICERLLPFIVHLTLSQESHGQQHARRVLSTACRGLFEETTDEHNAHTRLILKTLVYLRKQPVPQEVTKSDRSHWLDIDYHQAASAAVKCSMFKTALLFLDIAVSETAKASRRVSAVKIEEPTDLLLKIYKNIDEQDAFYGVQQPSSLTSMMARLEYEHAGFKSLSFRGAHYDSQIRFSPAATQTDEEGMVQALETLDLNGLSQSLLGKMTNLSPVSLKIMLNTARKLEQWDLSAPASSPNLTGSVFHAFQGINSIPNIDAFSSIVDTALMEAVRSLKTGDMAGSSIHEMLGTLAVLTEMDELCSVRDLEQLEDVWLRLEEREEWMHSESFDHVGSIVSCRETLFSSLSKSPTFQDLTKISIRDARTMEARALLSSSQMSRRHGALQNALAVMTYLNRLVGPCRDIGIDISAAVQFESAGVLWNQGEMAASISMLQDLRSSADLGKQAIPVGRPELLAKLGHQISEARLEKPDEIISQYLVPAIKELRGVTEGTEAGQVFHEFASFCDQQLQNPDSLEDFERIQKLRQTKEEEVQDLDRMIKSAGSQAKEKDNLKSYRNKAKLWFDLDDREFQRLRDSRQAFLRQSIENYLLALKACDKYDTDALRFSALWLQHYDSEIANEAVARHIGQVGSRKFASLMNQWSSRLLDVKSSFQHHLASLVYRICHDHPFHGMYQVFVGAKSRGGKDEAALGRSRAANNIVDELKSQKRSGPTWINVHNSNILFVRFAIEKLDDSKIKPGSKVALRKSPIGQRLEQEVSGHRVPPPTMKIDLRADCDYSSVPRIARFHHEFTVASGISMPKIASVIATDGTMYKQLFKSGNDDLRQDSIMEQVFEQVSNLLQSQRATRQRKLGIRTYKVLPLTATSGIIEFVQNTVPLHDYLMPAHQRHFPKDLKPTNCRKAIAEAQSQSAEKRIKVYRSVCNQFHPVLHYFFQERFENPDDWFDRRLAYTRSTAAISILGHILGLGDRHGHNILLDEKTGEVVHIDLGIAFEQGRVLPVPEVVPFRLTRDLVDGMGITRTEGVFRRCCEFTLEALRNESYSIMTILDVLRYDPLYSWSLSPLRLKKLQEAQTEAPGGELAEGDEDELGGKKKTENEPGEADRALTVVKKKLSKSLSVTATVNELIQQATDERNLALLFAGELALDAER